MVENFHGFCGLASNRKGFPAILFLSIIRCFELLYNRESFPTNNKKIMQPCNFSTANNLPYTVSYLQLLLKNLKTADNALKYVTQHEKIGLIILLLFELKFQNFVYEHSLPMKLSLLVQ